LGSDVLKKECYLFGVNDIFNNENKKKKVIKDCLAQRAKIKDVVDFLFKSQIQFQIF